MRGRVALCGDLSHSLFERGGGFRSGARSVVDVSGLIEHISVGTCDGGRGLGGRVDAEDGGEVECAADCTVHIRAVLVEDSGLIRLREDALKHGLRRTGAEGGVGRIVGAVNAEQLKELLRETVADIEGDGVDGHDAVGGVV